MAYHVDGFIHDLCGITYSKEEPDPPYSFATFTQAKKRQLAGLREERDLYNEAIRMIVDMKKSDIKE